MTSDPKQILVDLDIPEGTWVDVGGQQVPLSDKSLALLHQIRALLEVQQKTYQDELVRLKERLSRVTMGGGS